MRYRINLGTWASTVVEFETDETDPDRIAEAFYESCPDTPTLCHQCTGGGRGQNLELGDEWEISEYEDGLLILRVDDL